MGDKGEWETINKPETNHGQKKGTTGLDSRTSNKEQTVSEDKRFKKSLKSRKLGKLGVFCKMQLS